MEYTGNIVDISRKECFSVNNDDLLERPFQAASNCRQLLLDFESNHMQTKYTGVVVGDGHGRGNDDNNSNHAQRKDSNNAAHPLISSKTTESHNTMHTAIVDTSANKPSQPKPAEHWLRAGIRVKVTSKSFGSDVYLRKGKHGG